MIRTALAVALAVVGISVLAAQPPKPRFEAASIRPAATPPSPWRPSTSASFYRSSVTAAALIELAYGGVSGPQLIGGPAWIGRVTYEINATAGRNVSPEEMDLMLQSLLEDRFKLVARTEERDMRYEALRLRTNDAPVGEQLRRCEDLSTPPKPVRMPRGAYPSPLAGTCMPISAIASFTSAMLNTLVLDQTGLTGRWTYGVTFADPLSAVPSEVPALRTVLQEDLGLRLESARGPVKVVVIESVQEPTEN